MSSTVLPTPGGKSSALVGTSGIIGTREGDWLRAWEGTIKRCINMGRKEAGWVLQEPIPDATEWGPGSSAMRFPSGRGILPGLQPSFILDGYGA